MIPAVISGPITRNGSRLRSTSGRQATIAAATPQASIGFSPTIAASTSRIGGMTRTGSQARNVALRSTSGG